MPKKKQEPEVFDIVRHNKSGTLGKVRAAYTEEGTTVLDVEVNNQWRDILYRTPAVGWTVIEKEFGYGAS